MSEHIFDASGWTFHPNYFSTQHATEFVGGPWDGEVEYFTDMHNSYITRAGWDYVYQSGRMVLLGQAYVPSPPPVSLLWRVGLWLNHPIAMWRARP